MNTNFNKRQGIIGFSLLCCIWLFGITSQESNAIFANADLEENTDSLLVGIPYGVTAVEAKTILQDAHLGDLAVEKVWPEFGIALVRIPEHSSSPIMASSTDAMTRLETYRQALEMIPAINYVEYNRSISVSAITDKTVDRQISDIHQSLSQAPSGVTNDQEVVVALIDSGFGTDEIDPSTYPLWENQAEIDGVAGVDDDENGFIDDFHGWDWIENDNVIKDELGHGSAVGHVLIDLVEEISGDRNIVKLMPLRIMGKDGKGDISDLVDALDYASRQGVDIANLSLISYHSSPPLLEAIRIANSEDLLMVASTGNLSSRTYWPAAYPETLAVHAVLQGKDINPCRTSAETDIAIFVEDDDSISVNDDIPNVTELHTKSLHITSAFAENPELPNDKIEYTWMATPSVTAIAALALAQNPELSRDEIRAAVRAENSCGNGFPNAIRPLEIEELAAILQSPTVLPEMAEPQVHQTYLPLITR